MRLQIDSKGVLHSRLCAALLSLVVLHCIFTSFYSKLEKIGLDPSEAFNGAAYFSVTPQQAVVPVPGAAWLFFSGLGALGALRRIAPGARTA